jgi:hypothetical protein
MDKSKFDKAMRVIMERSWWDSVEWLTQFMFLAGGGITMLVYALHGQSIRPVLQVTVGGIVIERLVWAAHRAWWRLKHQRANQAR